MEDESIRTYVGRILEFNVGIRSQGGTKEDDDVIWKILKSLTRSVKPTIQMIQFLISCTKGFTKETLLRRLEVVESELRQSGKFSRTKETFSSLNVWPNLSRSTSARGDFSSSSRYDEERKDRVRSSPSSKKRKRWLENL